MPCDVNTTTHHHDINNVLLSIAMYCLQNKVKYCIIGGDFNANISRVNSMNTTSVHTFVLDEGLMFCMKSENCINVDYTYCGPNQAFSVIDQFIITSCLSSSIAVYKIISSRLIYRTLSWLDTETESCQRTVLVLALYMGCI